jgi:uncharacterized protein
MSRQKRDQNGPFHPGERAVQRRAGVAEDALRVGESIGGVLPPMAGAFLRDQRVAVAASLDDAGRVWASLVTGPAGFVKPVDDELLLLDGRIAPGDPLALNLVARPELGLLVIDLARRRRLRVNGRALLDGGRIFLTVKQAYGNCPKYIHRRLVDPVQEGESSLRRSATLDPRQQDWIAQADTLFIASYHPQGGADASHRGGDRGFVSVAGPSALSFPDYPGNNMFNTLGNIEAQPRVGLLFLDFETGSTLQLTGQATLEWQPETPPSTAGERAVVHFEIEEALEIAGQGLIARPIPELRTHP